MKNVGLIALLATLMLLCAAMQACEIGAEDKNTGIRADASAVSSVRAELEDKKNSLLAADGDVFWTASGTLWHSTYTCTYISRSKEIIHGSLDDALLAGKTGACTRCATQSGENDSVWESLESREPAEGDVFFVREGTVYHRSADCEELSGCEKICSGSRAVAHALGAVDECPMCSDDRN